MNALIPGLMAMMSEATVASTQPPPADDKQGTPKKPTKADTLYDLRDGLRARVPFFTDPSAKVLAEYMDKVMTTIIGDAEVDTSDEPHLDEEGNPLPQEEKAEKAGGPPVAGATPLAGGAWKLPNGVIVTAGGDVNANAGRGVRTGNIMAAGSSQPGVGQRMTRTGR